MLATGVRSQLGVKVFGDDAVKVEQAAIAIAAALMEVRGTRNAFAERATGAFYLDVRTDRARAARYGVLVEDVNAALEAAIGGTTVSQTVEGRERYAIQVRYAQSFRGDPDAVGRTLVPTSTGALVPLDLTRVDMHRARRGNYAILLGTGSRSGHVRDKTRGDTRSRNSQRRTADPGKRSRLRPAARRNRRRTTRIAAAVRAAVRWVVRSV
jgi:Cu/Ag efflux pump CusA